MSQKNPTILERLDMTERATEQLWKLFEANFGEVRKTLAAFTETASAILKAGGPEYEAKVTEELKKIRNTRFEAELARSKAVLDQLLDNKVIEATDTVTEDSIVTGRYLNKTTGDLEDPGYQQFEVKHFVPEAKAAILGQGAGFVYEAPGSVANFEITGVYKYVTKVDAPAPTPEAAVNVSEPEPILPPETAPTPPETQA